MLPTATCHLLLVLEFLAHEGRRAVLVHLAVTARPTAHARWSVGTLEWSVVATQFDPPMSRKCPAATAAPEWPVGSLSDPSAPARLDPKMQPSR
jgi:hypothetical protein